MQKRLFQALVALIAVLAIALPRVARADDCGDAKKLQKKAMDEDYLSAEYGAAEKKLNQALQKAGKCDTKLKALITRDLGMVHVQNKQKDQGVKDFAAAIALDSSVDLDKDLKTKEIEAAWNEAKKAGGGGGGGSETPPAGDFTHTPPAEQKVRTPLPVYVEYGGTEKIAKVVLKYKGFGQPDWKTIEMKKMGSGWGVETDCKDTQQGPFQYYIIGQDSNGDNIATSGDRNHPYKVEIKTDVDSNPHLPGKPAPKQCKGGGGDCPPDFPGCENKGGGKEIGDKCDEDAECASEYCNPDNKKCSEKKGGKKTGEDCEADSECDSGSCVKEGSGEDAKKVCAAASAKAPKIWVGLNIIAYDFNSLPGATNACALHSVRNLTPFNGNTMGDPNPAPNGASYYCTADPRPPPGANISDYPGSGPEIAELLNGTLPNGRAGTVAGGLAPGNFRVKASFDYAFHPLVLVGVRAGIYVATYGGGNAQNVHTIIPFFDGQLRITVGTPMNAKFGGYGFLGFGVSTFEGKVGGIQVTRNNGTRLNADAWTFGGPVYIPFGGGLRFAATDKLVASVGVQLHAAVGNPAFMFGFGPEVGLQYGF